MDLHLVGKNSQMQISELEEWREKAYHSSKIYKERTKRQHDKRIKLKEFKPRDKVLLFNSRVKLFGHGKLRSKWEGPFKVIEASSHGAITLQDDTGNTFKVNGQCLKVFLEPENLEKINVIEFLQFNDPIQKVQSCSYFLLDLRLIQQFNKILTLWCLSPEESLVFSPIFVYE